jgi:hygromycin-B 7''-O-kinase
MDEGAMTTVEYSKRLGTISHGQFQAALDHFNLGQFIRADAIPFGLFGQNVFLTSTAGEFVLRGTAHYDWQLPKEQFVANMLHEQTNVPVPQPYLVDTDETIFGWLYGYAIMPRMPGLQLADFEVLKTLSHEDRTAIAYAMGENLRDVQKAQVPLAGEYDFRQNAIVPFEGGFAGWIVRELRLKVQQSLSYGTGTTDTDAVWVEQMIEDAQDALNVPYTPVLVLHDYKEANVTVEKQGNRWHVSGVFDLMEAIFGDGEFDLARQVAAYLDAGEVEWAKAFLDGYRQQGALRPHAYARLALYLTYDRLVIWEYFHRPGHAWTNSAQTIEAWLSGYLRPLAGLLS